MKKSFITAYKHIRRTPYQAISAIAVLTLIFFIAATYFMVLAGSEKILTYFETRPQVTVFFQDQVTEADILKIQDELNRNQAVSNSRYISKEEALKIYQEQNKNDPLLLEMVTSEILPASLEISSTDVSYLPEIAKQVKEKPGVEEVILQEDVIEALTKWTKAVRISGIALLSFLAATSILIIVIIIGLKISSRKVEINILRLVGATNWYIIGPFILEGITYGILGSIFAWGLAYLLLLYSTPFLISFLGEIPLLPVPLYFMLILLSFMMALGTLIGTLASFLATRRFLG